MNSKQTGFTLIELVVVIVILGILAAAAIPRFTNISDNARQAVAEGVVGAVLSSAVIQFGESKGDPNDLGTIILQSGISSNESVFFSVDGGTTFKDLNSISADDPDIDCDDLTGTSITVAVNTTAGNTTAVGDIPAGICTG